jgi:poly(A) polymerase
MLNHQDNYQKRTFNIKLLNQDSIKICEILYKHGFDAWLVGGCIRDLLLDCEPKDYDITTVATPLEIKKIFKRKCLIIGRRFQITHVYMNSKEPIEVSTLRAMSSTKTSNEGRIINRQGRIEKDNIFGTSIKEDAQRRDFTINAIYYHPIKDKCIDYTSGIEDIEKGILRSIGNPKKRFAEDPLRMVRAIRLHSKTGLTISPEDVKSINESSHRLSTIPPARMLDESRKLFLQGHSLENYRNLRKYNLFYTLFPSIDKRLKNNPEFEKTYNRFIECALINTDKRVNEGKPVSIPFLFAFFLWADVQYKQSQKTKNKKPNEVYLSLQSICFQQKQIIRLSKFWIQQIIDIWLLHDKLIQHFSKVDDHRQAERLFNRPKFRAAYDFLCLRVESDEAPQHKEAARWWEDFQVQAAKL